MTESHVTYLYPSGHLQAVVPFWSVGAADLVAGWTPHGTEIMYWATADGQDPRSVPLDRRFKGGPDQRSANVAGHHVPSVSAGRVVPGAPLLHS